MTCPVCGSAAVPGARFCFSCGTAFDGQLEGTSDHSDLGAERRVVTVLFGDLSDFTAWAEDLDPERVSAVTDRVLASLANAVQTFGGHVDKLTGDGIMAVFGAPTAHEDDAERAVRAAHQMQEVVARLVADESGGGRQLGLRVGLNTGEVLAGFQASLSYTVVGDTVNTASRFSDEARVGGVLAGRETAAATLSIASWRALPPLRLKGKREPVAAYELMALRPRGVTRLGIGDEAPLVGREAELGLLVGRFRDAVGGRRPVSVLLAGDAGVGKTRLSRELATQAAEIADSRVLVGRCAPYGEGRDLVPLVEMVRTACGIDEDDDDETARDRVSRTVSRLVHPAYGGWAPNVLTDVLLGLLGLAGERPDLPRAGATPGDNSRVADELVGGLVTLFSGLARQGPLLLVLDDLQWASAELRTVAGDVAARLAGPILVLAIGRSELTDAHEGWAAQLPDPMLLPVAPLESTAAERLLRTYLGGSELDGTVAQAILERAQGNPFFLGELLHLLVDRGVLRRTGDGWVVDDALPLDVLPAGVQAVLAARIDGLDPGAKSALRDAAVVGPTFWAPALASLSGLDVETVRGRLDHLVEREIVLPEGDGAYRFAHTLTREVAYGAIPKGDRARRHAAVAGWAVTGLPGPPSEVDAFVAGQAEQAARLAREMNLPDDDPAWAAAQVGFDGLVRQGLAALSRDENPIAYDLFSRAMRIAGSNVDEADLVRAQVAYAEALAGLHRLDEAYDELIEPLASAEPALRAGALVVLGDIRRKQGDDAAAVEAFVSALATAGEAGLDRIAGEAIRQLGLIDYFGGRLREAEERFAQALELAERVDDLRGQGWALQHLAWSATTRGEYDLADERLSRAARVFASFDDGGGLGWCAGTEAYVRLLQGRLYDARELGRSVKPLAEAVQDRWGLAACLSIEAMSSAELGELSNAAENALKAEELYREIADYWGVALSLVAQGMVARGCGELDAATERLREAVQLCERVHHPTTMLLALLVLGWTRYDARDLDASADAAHLALDIAATVGLEEHMSVAAKVLLALVDRGRGRLAEARAALEAIAETPETPTLLFPMRQALAHLAGTLVECGEPEAALAAAERAVTIPAEDVRSQVIALRALGTARAAAGYLEGAEEALRAAVAAAYSTEQVVERAATDAALEALLSAAPRS